MKTFLKFLFTSSPFWMTIPAIVTLIVGLCAAVPLGISLLFDVSFIKSIGLIWIVSAIIMLILIMMRDYHHAPSPDTVVCVFSIVFSPLVLALLFVGFWILLFMAIFFPPEEARRLLGLDCFEPPPTKTA